MSTAFWWVFDAAVVVTAIYVLAVNAKRGVTKSLVLCIGYILTTVLASLLASVAAPTLYRSVAYENNITGLVTTNKHVDLAEVFTEAITEKNYGFIPDSGAVSKILKDPDKNAHFDVALFEYASAKAGGPVTVQSEFTNMLREAFIRSYGHELGERLPKYVRMYFEKKMRTEPDAMCRVISGYYNALNKSPEDRANALEQEFASKPTIEVLQIFIYFIIFSIVMVVVAIISALAQNKLFFNIQNSTDHAVGALIGVIEAGVMLVILTLIIRLLVLLGGGNFLFFNDETIAESKLFSFFYDHIGILL